MKAKQALGSTPVPTGPALQLRAGSHNRERCGSYLTTYYSTNRNCQHPLMWGSMDESVIGISAALHAALSSPATRYLDLDGSFDLARDVATGGFVLEEGYLRTTDAPGLGVKLGT